MHARSAFLLLCAASVAAAPAHAQEEEPLRAPPSAFGVRRWTTEEGLPSHYVPRLAQARDGALWLHTGGTPARFDGFTFAPTSILGPGSPPLGLIAGMATGPTDTLWVVTASGQLAYLDGGSYVIADSVGSLLRGIAQGGDGRLWLAGLQENWVRDAQGIHTVGPRAPPTTERLRATVVWADSTGRAWALTGPSTVARRLDDPSAPPLPESNGSLVPDERRGVVGTRVAGASVEVVDDSGSVLWTIPGDPASPLLVDREGRLWVEVPGALLVFEPGAEHPVRVGLGDATLHVLSLIEDRAGTLWAGTEENGLYRIQNQPIRVFTTSPDGRSLQVSTLARGRDGSVLGVDVEGRITRLTPAGSRTLVPRVPEGAAARSVTSTRFSAYEDRRGTMWIGAFIPQGEVLLGKRPGRSDVVIPTPGQVTRIAEDPTRDGVLWIVADGLYRTDAYRGVALDTLVSARWSVRDLSFGPDGDVWVAGLNGLVHLSGDEREEFPAAEGYPVSRARSVYAEPTGDVWIGTYRTGLVRIRGRTFETVTATDGLYENVVSAILPDDHGNLWMAGNRSIHRVAVADLDAFLSGRKSRVAGVGYTRRDGLRNPETSGWSAYRDSSGRLWFPTFDGAAMVDPKVALGLARDPPGVAITNLLVNGAHAATGGELRLAPDQRNLEIDFAGLFLRDPESLTYEIRLEPSAPDWQGVGSTRSVSYASLGPGDYRFSVRAINGAGVASTVPASVAFTVVPRFRETPWFPLLALLALTGAAATAWQVRLRAARARAETLSGLVDERTAQLREEKRLTEAQAERIRALDETRARFFANLSHELRTPLTLILGPLQDAYDAGSGAPSQLGPALANARRLNTLVDQLLDVARLESDQVALRKRPVDGVAFVREIAESFLPLAMQRGIRLDLRLSRGPVPVELDPSQADKIVLNLLGNAMKFTPRGGRVVVRARRDAEDDAGDVFVVEVEDDGPGIPEDEAERIFQRFHQVEASVPSQGGIGLGLSLSRDLAERHRGTLSVRSGPGDGACFSLRLPALPAGTPTEAATPSNRAEAWTPPSAAVAHQAPAPADDADPRWDEDVTTVLLVEDNADLRAWMKRHLEAEYRVVEASDGAQGLALALSVVPDVLITDVMMPGMSGEELCRAVKEDPEISFVPVILVTARGAREHRLGGLEGGADDYVVKPFDVAELLLRVRNLIAARRRLRERFESQSLRLPELPSLDGADADDASAEAFLADLRRVVLERLSDDELTVDDVAEALTMSRSTLYRRVESLFDDAPQELIWNVRLDQAALWLVETQASVGEIAYGVGFKSAPHFSRRFKERFGTTPTRYRREGGAEGSGPA